MSKRKKKGGGRAKSRTHALRLGGILLAVFMLWAAAGEWFVHHPRAWHEELSRTWPAFALAPLYWIGNPVADLTDGLGWTGHDAVYEYDAEAPNGSVTFAGLPQRVGAPAPDDIVVLDRGEFKIGWSDSLRHPVWCAYHVPRRAPFPVGTRPSFLVDRSRAAVPRPDAYKGSGYDRGHMVPNFAIATRFGETLQRLTFMMSNIAPQSAALNRGAWREIEHRIAELWTERYGEIWVVVGSISATETRQRLSGSGVDVPTHYYQVIMAQEGMDVRALAVLFPQHLPWSAWPARNIVSIQELQRLTGLDFNPDFPSFIRDPLEADTPTRLWPVGFGKIFRQLWLHYSH